MKKSIKTRSQKTGQALAIGGGIALGAALIAGAYFLYGKDGAKNRKKIRGWALKMKGEILEQMEQLPEISETMYNRVIEDVAKRYKALNHIDPKELTDIVKELKGHWISIKKQLTKKTKPAVKSRAKKATSKTTKRKPTSKKTK